MEATILSWKKKVGDPVEQDETILEIATDKVDSEVPSPSAGVITQLLFQENDVVPVGQVIAIISTEVSEIPTSAPQASTPSAVTQEVQSASNSPIVTAVQSAISPIELPKNGESSRFYSPLVRTIAKEENVSIAELDAIVGSGQGGRVTKSDILSFVQNRSTASQPVIAVAAPAVEKVASTPKVEFTAPAVSVSGNVEIIEMDRMRRLIADHMVMSKQVSPHVTSFVEADVTNLVNWRGKVKGEFMKKYGENITFTPIFAEAICRALRDFPLVNSSVDGNKIIVKKDLNIGMATAMPNGNLIVPVIKGADMLNLVGLTKQVNDLANRARNNQLKPEEIQGGTFTFTNVGGFGNVMGTPIINQPQVAILALGVIKKKPAVIETEYGDVIAVRQMMFLSLSYDHRIVDGSLGGSFLRRVADYLEQFDVNRSI
ncbi:2-oxoglutarate dehydrogese E2 component (dihydrolipoamide succinyltransferase) [Daphnia sinensis]|uniref:Dihydrolipoamide acetyltransferase component of pyruvate dehydrogenase complex n=1 Tax=Daphnia sinensis TaxID=1820382 RepID=A0AAD5L1G8_9CRUS|nr:2-oxoglutarate dehydrogese E2 component (dihydrolipoamide succinyltransferase) [Daphnia sinensis]